MTPTVVTTPGPSLGYESKSPQRTAGSILPTNYVEVVEEITGLSKLKAGWDSYGAEPVDEGARNRAVAFVTMVATHLDLPVPPPIVGPSVNGGVVLQWHLGNREIVVTISANGGEYYVAERAGDRVDAEGEVGNLDAFVKKLAAYLT